MRNYILVFFGCLLFHLAGTWSLPLIDRDEPRFAEAAREMGERADFIVPYFNNQFRFDKPPLTYWFQVASYRVFGENDFAARFPTAVAAALVALVLFSWGKRLRSRRDFIVRNTLPRISDSSADFCSCWRWSAFGEFRRLFVRTANFSESGLESMWLNAQSLRWKDMVHRPSGRIWRFFPFILSPSSPVSFLGRSNYRRCGKISGRDATAPTNSC